MRQLTYLLIAAVGLSLAASCALNQLEEPVQGGEQIVFTATVAQSGTGTRTQIAGDGPDIYWSPKDRIKILKEDWGWTTAVSDNEEPSQIAKFSVSIPVSAGALTEGNEIWALYPYQEDVYFNFDGQSAMMKMPSFQTAVAGTFDPRALLSVARTTTRQFSFYNVCGGLKFCVTRGNFPDGDVNESERIEYVELRSNDGTPLAGTATVRMDGDGIPYVDAVEDASDVVYLEAPEGGFVPGVWYYLVCLPAVLEEGFTLTFRNALDFEACLVVTEPREIKRSLWGVWQNADEGLDWNAADTPRYNEIWYGTTDNSLLDFDEGYYENSWYWGGKAKLVANRRSGDWCFLTFDRPVTKIPGWGPFSNSNLEWISLPETVQIIASGAFDSDISLTEVNLSVGLREIGESAFRQCNALTELEIPGSVEKMGRAVFNNCYKLSSLTGPLASGDGHCVVRDGELLAFAPGTESGEPLVEYAIPEDVTRLGDGCFAEMNNLISVSLPASLTDIGVEVFTYCYNLESFSGQSTCISPDGHLLVQDGEIKAAAVAGMTELTIPGSVNAIAPRTFYNCNSLQSLTIQEGLTSIGDEAFAYCHGLESVTLPQSLTDLGGRMFAGCNRIQSFSGKYETPDHHFLIREGELIAAALGALGESVTIPATVSRIGDYAFESTGITGLTLPDSVTEIGYGAFQCSQLASIEFGSGLRTIGDNVFWDCSELTGDLSLPDGLQSLRWCVFGYTGITSLTLPASLTYIGGQIADGCENLTWVKIKAATPPQTGGTYPITENFAYPIYVPEASRENYMGAVGWSNYAGLYEGFTEE